MISALLGVSSYLVPSAARGGRWSKLLNKRGIGNCRVQES